MAGQNNSAAAALALPPSSQQGPPLLFGQPALAGVASVPLSRVACRELFRKRAADEKEEAVWYEAAADGSAADEAHHLAEPRLSAPAPVRLRSVHSKQASVIRFCNKSGRDARALWVDFDGNEVAYSVVEPGATRLYRTYATHPWIVREAATGARMLVSGAAAVVGTADEQAVDITDPPALSWALDTHHCFPAPFKSAARALLLAHRRLARTAAAAATAAFCANTPPRTAALRLFSNALPPLLLSPRRQCPSSRPSDTPAAASVMAAHVSVSTPKAQLDVAVAAADELMAECTSADGRSARRWGSSLDIAPAAAPSPKAPAQLLALCSPRHAFSISLNTPGAATVDVALSPFVAVSLAPPLQRKRTLSVDGSSSGGGGLPLPPAKSSKRSDRSQPFTAAFLDGVGAPASSGGLGALPHDLVARIVELAAPPCWQGVHQPPAGRRAIRPTLLACHPDTKTQKEEEENEVEEDEVDVDDAADADDQMQVM